MKGLYKFQHSREQRAGWWGCCPKNDKWRQIASARPSASLPTSDHPRDEGSRSRDTSSPRTPAPHTRTPRPASDKGPGPGAKKNRGPCSLEGRKGSKPRPPSPEDRREAKSLPGSLQGGSGHRGASGGGRAWPGERPARLPGCGAAGSLGRDGQRGLSCPSSPHLPRRPAPAASLAVTHLPWFPPGPSLSPISPAERARAASTRLRQGYEVH